MRADTSWVDGSNGNSRQFQMMPDQGSGAGDPRRPIGEIFVELGFVTRAELQSALDVQRRSGGRIGEILVDQGSLSRIDLASALAEHWEPHAYAEEGESLEPSLDVALRSAIEHATGELDPGAPAKPKRSRLRRSTAREEALEEQVGRLSEQLAAVGRESQLRASHDRAVAVRFQELTLRLDRVESRSNEIERLEAELGAVSELTSELRNEVSTLARHEPVADANERLLELSLRIDRAARDSHGRIAALSAELRTEMAVKSAGLDVRLQAQLDEAAALQRQVVAAQEAAASTLSGAEETIADLQVEIGSLAGRLDELFGLRHADAQVARVASERLGARLEGLIARTADEAAAALAVAMDSWDDPRVEARVEGGIDKLAAEVAELTRRLEQQDAILADSARVTERAVLEGLTALGKRLAAKAGKTGKPSKRLRHSMDSLGAVIAAADARLAEHDSSAHLQS